MRALKILAKIFFVLSTCFICAFCPLSLIAASAATIPVLAVLLGAFLRYAKGDVQTRIGNALYIFGCLFVLVTVFLSEYFGLGSILALAGDGFAGFGYFVEFLVFVKTSKNASRRSFFL